MLKKAGRYFFGIVLLVSIASASIPLHNILHNHHFLPIDDCHVKLCKNHIKSHNEHCHTFSDAVFIAKLDTKNRSLKVDAPFSDLIVNFKHKRYAKYLYFCKNKAPPLLIAA
jgi:hypothetical protein